jgi:hypothetical protein
MQTTVLNGIKYMTVREAIAAAENILPGHTAPDGVEDPRWQAVIQISHFVAEEPEVVWPFVLRWGSHEDEDLRTAIATCLLEHLLEYHFDLIFPRVEAAVYGRIRLADLIPPVAEAFLKDQITIGHALLIAKLPASQQQEAFSAAFRGLWTSEGNSQVLIPVRELALCDAPHNANNAEFVFMKSAAV